MTCSFLLSLHKILSIIFLLVLFFLLFLFNHGSPLWAAKGNKGSGTQCVVTHAVTHLMAILPLFVSLARFARLESKITYIWASDGMWLECKLGQQKLSCKESYSYNHIWNFTNKDWFLSKACRLCKDLFCWAMEVQSNLKRGCPVVGISSDSVLQQRLGENNQWFLGLAPWDLERARYPF